MRTTVSLNGVELGSLAEELLVLGVEERAPTMAHTTLPRGTRDGQWVTGGARSYLEVAVSFAIRSRRDRVLRAQTLERVNAWAMGGGLLRAGHRPGRRLRVVCDTLPAAGNAAQWTTEYEITFRAYEVPYWESDAEQVITLSAAQWTGELERIGTEAAPMRFSARNAGEDEVDALTVTAGETRMEFSGLALAQGEALEVYEDDAGLLCIFITGTDSVRETSACRMAESDDRLLLTQARTPVTVYAAQELEWTLAHRGRYA